MTIEEMQQGYLHEVEYQKHMLKNLSYWFQLFFTASVIGVVLIYSFHMHFSWLLIVGIILLVLGSLGMFIFGYASWRGKKNVSRIIDDYEQKITEIKKIDKNVSAKKEIHFK